MNQRYVAGIYIEGVTSNLSEMWMNLEKLKTDNHIQLLLSVYTYRSSREASRSRKTLFSSFTL